MWSGWGHFEEIPSHIFGTEIPDSSGIGHSQKNANFTQYSARSAIYTSISSSQDRFWFQVKYVFLNSSLALRIDDAFLFVDPYVSVRASDIQLQVKRMKTRMLTGAFDRIAEMARDYTDGRQSRLHCSGRGDNAKNIKKKGWILNLLEKGVARDFIVIYLLQGISCYEFKMFDGSANESNFVDIVRSYRGDVEIADEF